MAKSADAKAELVARIKSLEQQLEDFEAAYKADRARLASQILAAKFGLKQWDENVDAVLDALDRAGVTRG